MDSRAPDEPINGAATVSFGSREALDVRVLGGVRWADGYASLSANFERSDGFVPVVAADRGTADQRAPYQQGAARGRVVQSVGGETEAQLSVSTYRDRRSRGTTLATVSTRDGRVGSASRSRGRCAGRHWPTSMIGYSTASSPR